MTCNRNAYSVDDLEDWAYTTRFVIKVKKEPPMSYPRDQGIVADVPVCMPAGGDIATIVIDSHDDQLSHRVYEIVVDALRANYSDEQLSARVRRKTMELL